jgi:hypothetical protein
MSRFKIGERVRVKNNYPWNYPSSPDFATDRDRAFRGRVGIVTARDSERLTVPEPHPDYFMYCVELDGLDNAKLYSVYGAELEYEDDSLDLALWGAGLNLSSVKEVMEEEEEKEIERAFDESQERSRIVRLERAVRAMTICLHPDDPAYATILRIGEAALEDKFPWWSE